MHTKNKLGKDDVVSTRLGVKDDGGRIGYGGLGLDLRLSDAVGFADAMRRMQLDIKALKMCVVQTLEEFARAGGDASELDEQQCLFYSAQAMFSSVVLSMGDWERSVVNATADMDSPGAAEALDHVVLTEMFRVGMFNALDSAVVRQYKHMVFMESWSFTLENDLLRCGLPMQASVARVVCNKQWVENGFVTEAEFSEAFATA